MASWASRKCGAAASTETAVGQVACSATRGALIMAIISASMMRWPVYGYVYYDFGQSCYLPLISKT